MGKNRERAAILLEKYGNAILRTAYSYLHNMEDAEDILQDTLIQYLKSDSDYNDESHEKAWLLHRRHRGDLRKKRTHHKIRSEKSQRKTQKNFEGGI